MKTCPYCAEEIQDAAIKCRYCHSDLTVAPAAASGSSTVASAAPASTQAPASNQSASPSPAAGTGATPGSGAGEVRYTHSGHRYVLGFGPDFFGLWDRQAPSVPAERWSRDDEGWRKAWTRFAGLEPHHVAVPQEGQATASAMSTPMSAAAVGAVDNDATQYTHSGQRYLLGYGRTFFGIWDRTAPAAPVERFSRDDAGWEQAWRRFTSLETNYSEVGLGGAGSGSGSGSPSPTPSGS